jgi:uncharacterized protein (TIGR02646 family)
VRRIDSVPPPTFGYLKAKGADFSRLASVAREQLYQDQKGLCAYCERKIRPDDGSILKAHKTVIEHFHPQHGSMLRSNCELASGAKDQPSSRSEWTNLLLCCDGNRNSGGAPCCDNSKGDSDICADFRNPKQVPATLECLVDVGNSGRLSAKKHSMPDGADEVIDTELGLNSSELIEARRRKITELKRRLSRAQALKHGLNKAQKDEFARKIREEADQFGFEFPSAYLAVAQQLEST